jgi:hypothetical protein
MAVRTLFVHGVANRREGNETSFDRGVAQRDAMFKGILGKDAVIANPYWGDLGGKLRWNGQCLPTTGMQAFGIAPQATDNLLIDSSDTSAPLLAIVRKSQTSFIDLISIGLAELGSMSPEDLAQTTSDLYQFAQTTWSWLPAVTSDDELRLQLQVQFRVWKQALPNAHQGPQAFGFIDDIGQGISHVVGWTLNAASDQLLLKLKPLLTQYVVRFFGDIFVYLHNGRQAIRQRILDSLLPLWNDRQPGDKFMVVCHSFGGPIFMDMLLDPASGLPADLEIGLVVSVGSQIGLFWEMDLYTPELAVQGVVPPAKAPRPRQVANWINVLDLADPLAFRLEPIMDQVQDTMFNTETSLLNAHTTYFERPSFYDRLNHRMDGLQWP